MSNTMPPFSMGGWCPRSCVGMSIAVLIDLSLNRITNMGGEGAFSFNYVCGY